MNDNFFFFLVTLLKVGRHEYELQSYRIPSTASGYGSIQTLDFISKPHI